MNAGSHANIPKVIVRLHNYNQVSFGAILGACPKELLDSVKVVLWKSTAPFPVETFSGKVLLLYSYMMPHEESVKDELQTVFSAIDGTRVPKTLAGGYPREGVPPKHSPWGYPKEGVSLVTLAGGSQVSSEPEKALELGFSSVIAGDAEKAFPEFLKKWLAGESLPKITRVRPGLIDLDKFPGFHPVIGYLPPIEITRGCRFGCAYCAVPSLQKGTLRHRSVEAIASIVESYWKIKPDRKRIKFLSPNAFAYGSLDGKSPNLAAIKNLLQTLKDMGVPGIKFGAFPAEVRPDFVTRELLELITPYIFNRTIVMGIQSISDEFLRKMARGHTFEDAVRAIKLLREFGYTPHVDFIIGLPGENEKNQEDLLTFMENLVHEYSIRIHMHTFMPLPGTPWKHLVASNISSKIKKRLRKLSQNGHLDGWWENQIAYSRKRK